MKKNILVFLVAHTYGQLLGCGGTLAKCSKKANFSDLFFMTVGLPSRDGMQYLIKKLEFRNNSPKSALKILGINSMSFAEHRKK